MEEYIVERKLNWEGHKEGVWETIYCPIRIIRKSDGKVMYEEGERKTIREVKVNEF